MNDFGATVHTKDIKTRNNKTKTRNSVFHATYISHLIL